MTPPDSDRLMAVLDATWRPAARADIPGWAIRLDAGGGRRVSAASALNPGTVPDITAAEAAMQAQAQTPLFRLRDNEAALHAALAARGYRVADPTVILAARPGALTAPQDRRGAICDMPLAVQAEIWAAGGIGAARLAVMARAARPRAWLLSRTAEAPAATAFVAMAHGIAMLHAVEVAARHRGAGHGRRLLLLAGAWAAAAGADWLALAVTRANAPALALYQGEGMRDAAGYSYRVPGGP